MIESNAPTNAINKMKNGLVNDGWSYDKNLPSDWMVKFSKCKTIYLSHEFATLRSNSKVLNYMESKGYASHEITRMKEFMNNRTKDRDHALAVINYSDKAWTNDPSLPKGWMICEEKETSLIKCPDAEVFESRKKAIEKMIK